MKTASRWPVSLSIASVCWPPSSTTSARTSLAPSRAKIREVARPMPEPAPVMSATLPSRIPAMGLFLTLLHREAGELARGEFPLAVNLHVVVVIEAGADPLEIFLRAAQLDVAAPGRRGFALQIDHVIVNIGPRIYLAERARIHLMQVGVAFGGNFALAPLGDELPVFGKQIDHRIESVLPHAVAVAHRQLANRLAVGKFGYQFFG